jgi:hypothetical protein
MTLLIQCQYHPHDHVLSSSLLLVIIYQQSIGLSGGNGEEWMNL